MTLDTSFQPLLVCKASFEKSADSFMGIVIICKSKIKQRKDRMSDFIFTVVGRKQEISHISSEENDSIALMGAAASAWE